MDVKMESEGGLVRQLRVRIPAEQVDRALDAQLKRLAARVRIPGFRPGKAPFKVVQQQYGAAARMDVINDLVRGSYPEAVGQAGVRPASAPNFEVMAERPGEPLEYVARFEVYPEVKLKALKDLRVDRPVVDITEGDVDNVIQSMRRARRTLRPVERPARDGDVCTVDFEGQLDGKPFDGGKGEDAEIEIGRGQMLKDLEQGLVGRKEGERFEVPVTFPDDYRREDLRGRPAVFAVALKQVREAELPPVDAEFLKAHGAEPEAGEDGLRARVRSALEAERGKASRARMKQQVLDRLLAGHPLDLPRSMVAQELERLREETAARFNAGRLKQDQKQKLFPDEMLQPAAQRRVALGLLVGEVIRQEKVELDGARLDRALDEIAADYQQPEQVKQYYRSRPELMQGLRAMVLEEQVVERLLAGAQAADVRMSLDELLGPSRREG